MILHVLPKLLVVGGTMHQSHLCEVELSDEGREQVPIILTIRASFVTAGFHFPTLSGSDLQARGTVSILSLM